MSACLVARVALGLRIELPRIPHAPSIRCAAGRVCHSPWTIVARAHTKPESSRATAALARLAGLPRDLRRAHLECSLALARPAASATAAGTPRASASEVADMGLKREALDKVHAGRVGEAKRPYRPDDDILSFLEAL